METTTLLWILGGIGATTLILTLYFWLNRDYSQAKNKIIRHYELKRDKLTFKQQSKPKVSFDYSKYVYNQSSGLVMDTLPLIATLVIVGFVAGILIKIFGFGKGEEE